MNGQMRELPAGLLDRRIEVLLTLLCNRSPAFNRPYAGQRMQSGPVLLCHTGHALFTFASFVCYSFLRHSREHDHPRTYPLLPFVSLRPASHTAAIRSVGRRLPLWSGGCDGIELITSM